MKSINIKSLCKDHILFQGIKEEELKPMMKCIGAYKKRYKKHSFIILEEDQVKSVGIVLQGSVAMVKEDIWGTKAVVTNIYKNELLGETFVCGKEACASTVSFQAQGNVEILFLPFDKVMHTCNMNCIFHHRLIENMVGLIADKNMEMINKVNIMSQKTLREKISAYLSDQALKNGKMEFEIPLGRVRLAEYLCADRSAVTRELNYMKEERLIDFEKNKFCILKNLYK